MSTNKLTIVPVQLDSLTNESLLPSFSQFSSDPSCIIKTATAEILFFNGIDERIVQTVMKELSK